jgi:hypothetical protein
MPTRKRKTTAKKTETDALARSRHRCALCYGLYRDSTVKQGQLAHLDRNPANSSYANLVFLCLPHHDQYDSSTSQSKNFSPGELRRYRGELDGYVRVLKGTPWPDFSAPEESPPAAETPRVPSSLEVYDRRIVVYRALRDFLMAAVREASLSVQDMGRFAEATDEALFLLGPEVSEYLRLVYSKGVRLHYTSTRIHNERLAPREDYSEVVHENAEVLNWFVQQLEASRIVFSKVLRLA